MHKGMTFLIAVIFLAGCSGAQLGEDCKRLDWADKPPKNCAVGVAQGISTGNARTNAEEDGKFRLASAMQKTLQGLFGRSVETILSPVGIEGSELVKYGDESVYKVELGTVRNQEYFRDCTTGDQYVLVCISDEELRSAAEMAARKALLKSLPERRELHDDVIKDMRQRVDQEFGN